MESGKCIFCGGGFENKEGCKPKKYCSELCKVKQFQKTNPKGSLYVRILKSEYDELVRRVELSDLSPSKPKEVQTEAQKKEKPVMEQKGGHKDIFDMPTKADGEKALDFNIRMAEWIENKNRKQK